MLVAALLGGLGRPVDGRDLALAVLAELVGDDDAPRPEVDHVALLEEDDPVRMGEDRRDVRGQEALAVGQADDQRHVLPGADEAIALGAVHDDDRVGALDRLQGVADGLGQVALVGLLDQVGDRLGVGLRREAVAAGLEPVAQLPEVLDDAVVDDRDLAGAVLVGMGVEVIGPAMRRPAGMREADGRMGRAVRDGRLQVDELAGPLVDEEVARVVDQGDPGRIVAAVLEAFEALDEDGARVAGVPYSRRCRTSGQVLRSPPPALAGARGDRWVGTGLV